MPNEEHFHRLENLYHNAPINQHYLPKINISEGRAEVILKIRPVFHHGGHYVHGGVYFKHLDDAAYFAVNSLVEDVTVATVSFNIYFTRPIAEGEMRAAGCVVHASQRIFVAEAEMTDASGHQIARGSGMYMRTRVPLTGEVGYA
jgi:uncharacterized protein (TIGR00369 family)